MQMQTKRMLLRDIRPAAYNPRKRLEPGDYVGASWVITLAFEHASDARAWAEENGHSGAVKNGASTTVIRMD